MSIRVTCRCGQNLSVSDAMAGKSGKCPKCSEVIKIPAASGSGSNASAAKPKSPPAVQAAGSSTTKRAVASTAKTLSKAGALDQLFAEAGLDKAKGPECPSCKEPIDAAAEMCVRCGFNLTTGQMIKGVKIESASDPGQFANRQLNDAKKSLKKEFEADEKAKFSGAPWWVSAAVVMGILITITFGVLQVNGRSVNDKGESLAAPSTSIEGKIQRLPPRNAALLVGFLVSAMVTIMAWLATVIAAFYDKAVEGILCLFIPLYAHFYCFKHRQYMGTTMKALWGWTVAVIPLAIGAAPAIQFLTK